MKNNIYKTATSYRYSNDNSLVYRDFEIIQLAKAQFKKDKQKKYFFNQQKHYNACDEITLVVSGQGTADNNDMNSPITQGQLHIVFKSQMHCISSLSLAPLTFYCIAFNIFETSELYPLYTEVKKYCLETNSYITLDTNSLLNSFELLLQTFSSNRYNNIDYFNQAMETSIKYILTMSLLNFIPAANTNSNILIEQIKTFLIFNSNNPSALKLLPAKLNYSYTYLSHFFKNECGYSLSVYFKSLRMNHAKDLLAQGNSVSSVSDELGYSSIHAFSRAFKNFFGFIPSSGN